MSDLRSTLAAQPGMRLVHWWREHERSLLIGMAVIGGLTAIGFAYALYKAAPIAAKIALGTSKGAAAKATLIKAGLLAA